MSSPCRSLFPTFVADASDTQLGADIAKVIAADLKRSGLFQPLDPSTFTQRITNPDQQPGFADWRVINAQALVTGSIDRQADGRLRAEFRLWDVFAGQQMAGQQLLLQPDNWRRIAHIIADAIYERLTGEKGYFDTRIVFVDETGPKNKRVKRLAIMDQDGANVRYLTRGTDLVLTPRFNPAAQEITYMSYGADQPRVYLLNIETGQREVVGDFPGMTFAPRFSPGRPAGRAQPAAGRQRQHLYDGSALAADDPADRRRGDRHQPLLFAGRTADRLRIRPRRLAAALRHDRQRRQSAPHHLRAGHLFDAGLVAARRPHRLYAAQRRQVRHRRHPAGRHRRCASSPRASTTRARHGRRTGASSCSSAILAGETGGPQLWTIDITGYNEQRVPTPSFASDPAWSALIN